MGVVLQTDHASFKGVAGDPMAAEFAKKRNDGKKDPSRLTKERITLLMQESINESGKIAKYVTQRSNSREVSK